MLLHFLSKLRATDWTFLHFEIRGTVRRGVDQGYKTLRSEATVETHRWSRTSHWPPHSVSVERSQAWHFSETLHLPLRAAQKDRHTHKQWQCTVLLHKPSTFDLQLLPSNFFPEVKNMPVMSNNRNSWECVIFLCQFYFLPRVISGKQCNLWFELNKCISACSEIVNKQKKFSNIRSVSRDCST